jgi:hypothetical protein
METNNFEKYFYNTRRASPLESLFDNLDSFNWTSKEDNDQYQDRLDQSLIFQDEMLSKIHPFTKGALSILLLPPKCMYRWHLDRRNICNINLLDSVTDKYTIFRADKGEHPYSNREPSIHSIPDLQPFIETDATPLEWLVLDAQVFHAGINFSDKPKYMVQYAIKLTKSDLSYQEIVNFIKAM